MACAENRQVTGYLRHLLHQSIHSRVCHRGRKTLPSPLPDTLRPSPTHQGLCLDPMDASQTQHLILGSEGDSKGAKHRHTKITAQVINASMVDAPEAEKKGP